MRRDRRRSPGLVVDQPYAVAAYYENAVETPVDRQDVAVLDEAGRGLTPAASKAVAESSSRGSQTPVQGAGSS